MGKQGFRDVGTDVFVSQEITSGGSAAIGLDNSDSDKFKIVASSAVGSTPSSPNAQITIDGSTNGNISIDPNGTGLTDIVSGNMRFPDDVPTSAGASGPLTSGMITKFAGGVESRWIHNLGINALYVGILAGPASISNTTTSGIANVALGDGNLTMIDTSAPGQANANTAIGQSSLTNLTTGNSNVSIGGLAYLTTGSNNTAIGAQAGQTSPIGGVTSGSHNVFVGQNAGGNLRSSESSCIYIGDGVGGKLSTNNVMQIGNGTGTGTGQINQTFISGIRGITTGVNDAVAVFVDSANQLGVTSSSQRYKTNIHDLAEQSEVIYQLKPKAFEMRAHPGVPDWGLIAEEVSDVFPQICVYKDGEPETVQYHRLVPLLLNEVQKLRKEIDALKK